MPSAKRNSTMKRDLIHCLMLFHPEIYLFTNHSNTTHVSWNYFCPLFSSSFHRQHMSCTSFAFSEATWISRKEVSYTVTLLKCCMTSRACQQIKCNGCSTSSFSIIRSMRSDAEIPVSAKSKPNWFA